jgi:hypothetical protein
MDTKNQSAEALQWTVSVPIFQHAVILRHLTIAIGIPFGLLCLFLFFSSNGENRIYAIYALSLIAMMFLLTYLLIILLYRGNYDAGFRLDTKGIHFSPLEWCEESEVQPRTACHLAANWINEPYGSILHPGELSRGRGDYQKQHKGMRNGAS